MKKLSADEIERWITLDNGVHVPIKKGETEADAIKRLGTFINTVENKEITSDYKHTKLITGSHLKYGDVPKEVIDSINKSMTELNEQFPEIAHYIDSCKAELDVVGVNSGKITSRTVMSTVTSLDKEGNRLGISGFYVNREMSQNHSLEALKEYVKKCVEDGYHMPCSPENYAKYLVAHEYGHIVQTYYMQNKHDWNYLYSKSTVKNNKFSQAVRQDWQEVFEDMVAVGTSKGYIKNLEKSLSNLSTFACSQAGKDITSDIFAESFANMICGKPNEWGKTMEAFLKQEGIL